MWLMRRKWRMFRTWRMSRAYVEVAAGGSCCGVNFTIVTVVTIVSVLTVVLQHAVTAVTAVAAGGLLLLLRDGRHVGEEEGDVEPRAAE